MRCVLIVYLLLLGFCSTAWAGDFWILGGRCTTGIIKQAAPTVDMTKMRGTAISCDAASIMEFDNGRKMVQFIQKEGKLNPPGFAGSEFKYAEGNYSLVLDRIYPQRTLAGKSTEEIMKEGSQSAMPAKGYCFFSDSDFTKLTDLSCVSKTENADTKIVYQVSFAVKTVTAKHDFSGTDANQSSSSVRSNENFDIDRIFEYTIFDKTLENGKHPVWMYFETAEKIIKVTVPSLDMCLVTDHSDADLGVIRSKNYDLIPKGTDGWEFALNIWKAALQRFLVVGQPKAC